MNFKGAFLSLTRSPGFTAVAVLMLALGVGASATLFTVVYGVLLKPLPYRDADRLVIVRAEQEFEGARRPVAATFPTAAVDAWPATSTLEQLAFHATNVAALAGVQSAERVNTAIVSASFFATVDGAVLHGRGLSVADDRQPAIVISERLAQRRFGGAANALNQALTINARPVTVIGVASHTFQIPEPQTDVWMPAGFVRPSDPGCCGFTAIARLRPGVTMNAAASEVDSVTQSLAAQVPRSLRGARTRLIGLRESVAGDTRPALRVLSAAVALLLVLACVNVMNLLLARGTSRIHETAVRRALGASRARLVAAALGESILIAATGSAVGIGIAALSIRLLKTWPSAALPRLDAVALDGVVVAFVCLIGTVSALAIGLLPALHSGNPAAALSGCQRGNIANPFARLALGSMTVVQLAIAVVLIVGAVLLGRSLVALMDTELGVEPDGVVTASMNLGIGRRLTDQQQIELVDRIVQRISQLPQVTAVGVGAARPPDVSEMRLTLNRSDDPGGRSFQAAAVPATPDYFSALGIRLERGRLFTHADHGESAPVVVMSAATERILFRDQDALGQTMQLPVLRNGTMGHDQMTIVGIVDDVKYSGMDQVADAVVYRPFAQQPWTSVFLVARTSGDPLLLANRLPAEIGGIDRAITIASPTTLNDVLSDVTSQPRLRTLLLSIFAALAIAIAAVGVYALVAYTVLQRTSEIGVRMALGASTSNIRRMVLREGLVLAVLGGALGLGAAYGLTQVLTALLFGVTPTDAASFAVATAAVVCVGLIASYLPARRAARIDPVTAIRAE